MTIDPELVTRKLLLIAADLAALGPDGHGPRIGRDRAVAVSSGRVSVAAARHPV